MPAEAGIHVHEHTLLALDSRVRGNDDKTIRPLGTTPLVTPAEVGVQEADGLLAALDSLTSQTKCNTFFRGVAMGRSYRQLGLEDRCEIARRRLPVTAVVGPDMVDHGLAKVDSDESPAESGQFHMGQSGSNIGKNVAVAAGRWPSPVPFLSRVDREMRRSLCLAGRYSSCPLADNSGVW
jgi:hypothetical protein